MLSEEVLKSVGITPTLSPYRQTGFHGTSEQAAEVIVGEGFQRELCREGHYGRGFYFFEDNAPHSGKGMAVNFIECHRKHISVPAVVQSDIDLEKALDLVSSAQNLSFFNKVMQLILDKIYQHDADFMPDERRLGSATVAFLRNYCTVTEQMDGIRVRIRVLKVAPPEQDAVCVYEIERIGNNRHC